MVNETLIEGFIYNGPGCCSSCCGPLVVADSEISIMELNKEGTPVSEETTVRCVAVCRHCGRKTPMMRWKGNYIPYSPTVALIKKAELENEANQRISALNNKNKDKNPFLAD